MPAGRAILVMLVALGLASLLNISSLRAAAERQPFGWHRTVAVVLVAPLGAISDVLALDEPRELVDRRLRSSPGQAVSAPDNVPDSAPDSTPASARADADRTFGPGDPLRIWVVGDSLTEQLGPAVRELAEGTRLATVEHEMRYSSGLSRPDFFDWPGHLATLGARADPDVWVVMFGGNDAQGIKVGGRHLEFGTPAWDAEYRSRIAEVMADLSSEERQVVWVGQPIPRAEGFSRRMAHLNDLYRAEAEHHEGVSYVDSWELFAGPDGAYTAYLPDLLGRPVLMRLGDGVHLSRAGGDRLALPVFEVIGDRWGLGPSDTA
jgi:hypothetical protein